MTIASRPITGPGHASIAAANVTNERILASKRLLRQYAYEAMKYDLVVLPAPHVISHLEMNNGKVEISTIHCGSHIFRKCESGHRCMACMPHPDLPTALKQEIERIAKL